MLNILVVCTANICRSPAAQVFLNDLLRGNEVRVESAGTLAIDGNIADPTIQQLMIERGYPEIEHHRSRALMPHHIFEYQLILCMERDHLDLIRKNYPVAVGKSMMLSHWENNTDVVDPFGRDQDEYIDSLNIMQTYTQQWATKIVNMGLVE